MPDSLLPPVAVADMIQFHVLTAFPPHNVNRDEDGRPKTCQLGGVTRGRISSQAKKRALRLAPHFPTAQRATRTRKAGIHTFLKLTAAGIDTTSAVWAALAVNHATGGGGKPPKAEDAQAIAAPDPKKQEDAYKKKEKAVTDMMEKRGLDRAAAEQEWLTGQVGTEQGLVISTREFARIEEGIAHLTAAWAADRDGFPAVLEGWVRQVCKESLLTKADHDLDTALFGRMVAANANFNVEAACAVGHAFTTHRFALEGDYFSAGEELKVLGGTGAVITGYAFFGGGVYYQHAVLDRGHLRTTLSRGRSAEEAERLTVQAVDTFLTGLLFSQPRGKCNSHASDVAASYVLATRGGDPALNLGLAFLDPVKATEDVTDLMCASIRRLTDFHRALTAAYGLGNAVCVLNAYPPARGNDAPRAPEVWTVEDFRRFVQGRGA
ncbi:type I-E CRISPR-associated protein Cas7/Cse4/CasC [Rhodospirillum centenum]|uniref:CRISPR-associated protein, CT1975 family n=1 Tax=Rhodospirillum centenum (strain ATCC 51521 / SW) TaxID=414684 RepID=B6IWM4_RHOCS|nr:type I-E CRISPR-associated protein Cas7/Cse4/CasC [Rhodospirillum centenum]ACJ00698.1 CRISPR-associated protein, CT1975 family [Rhodospirillum centenum SW]